MMVEPLRVTFKSRKCIVVEGASTSHLRLPQLFKRVLKLFQVLSLLVFGGDPHTEDVIDVAAVEK
jgi:hypothetical protein